MITKEEIRDIVEEAVYIGSGTVLGVGDAASIIAANIEELEESQQK